MAQRSSNGGCIALVVILVAVGVGIFLLFAVFFTKRVSSEPPSYMSHPAVVHESAGNGEERLVFTEATRPRLSVPAPGEPVTLKVFAAYMMDGDATELAKDSFRKTVDKAEVSWKLRLEQIGDRSGPLQGKFNVPWEIRHGGGSHGSSFNVNAEFDEAGRAALLNLRRGDWVTVEGQLTLEHGTAMIKNAVIADAEVAEKP